MITAFEMVRIEPITPKSIAEAAACLRAGRLTVFPTETVYGLGADTFNIHALAAVYALKGRPSDNPLIAHVADADAAKQLTAQWDNRCEKLAKRFWPGPLTMVLKKSHVISTAATAGLDTIAVRCPAHPGAQQLLRVFAGPISAPSANRSGHISPTTADHVAEDFAEVNELLILDGGPCEIGIESTVVDLTEQIARVLRPGEVSANALRDVLGEVKSKSIQTQAAGPGTTLKHYAPRTPTELVSFDELQVRLRDTTERLAVLTFSRVLNPSHIIFDMPNTPVAYAHLLYGYLRQADQSSGTHILIERPPDNPQWLAVYDRLRRATGGAG